VAARIEGSAAAERGFGVWRRNWGTLLAFLSVSTQWRAVARGLDGRIYWMGLDYTAVRAGLDGDGIKITPRLWAGIKTMERAARDALNGVEG
jgi:Phage related hypothetical protein (DUF1799)